MADVKILGLLFDNDGHEDIISADDPKIAEDDNNIAIISPTLFVPWDCLPPLFMDIAIINNNYVSFCWTN